jgi:hypothetical protein
MRSSPRAERAATAKFWPVFRTGRTFEERRLSAVGDTVDRMAYDTELADRIRELVASERVQHVGSRQ